MKVYLAALFSRREEMHGYASRLTTSGFEVTSSWVYGGEDGLSREDISLLDLRDVDRADVVISFTHPRGSMTTGGGRHVEFGYAAAKGKRLILVGERENVFHHLPSVEVYADLDALLARVR